MTDNEHWNIRYPLQSIWNPSNKIYTKEDEIKGLISIIAGYEECQKSYEQEIAELKKDNEDQRMYSEHCWQCTEREEEEARKDSDGIRVPELS